MRIVAVTAVLASIAIAFAVGVFVVKVLAVCATFAVAAAWISTLR